MLARLLDLALRHRIPVLVTVLAMATAGIWSFKQVTIPIERALNNTPRLISRRSRTIFGLSIVELTFSEGTNDYFARQLVLDKLRDATLPDGVTPTLAPLSTGVGEFYRYVLVGKGYDTMQLRELQDWVVTQRLLQIS